MIAFAHHRRAISAPAAIPATATVAPAVLTEASAKVFFAAGTGAATTTVAANAAGGGNWVIEGFSGYYDGAGAYSTANAVGYEFQFYGTRFVLEGLANVNGGDFSVGVNGAASGTGNCANATLTRKVYYDSGVLPLGLYTVRALKTSGSAFYLDRITLS